MFEFCTPAHGDALLDQMARHRSVRDFQPEPVAEQDILRAVETAQSAATSSALQGYTLFRVRNDAHREQLVDLCGGQPWIRSSGAFFCLCIDTRRWDQAARLHELPLEENFESFLLGALDTALFAQNLALAFESLGYGTCFIGGLRNRLPEVDRLLEVPPRVMPLFGLCVGRPASDPGQRPRLAPSAVLQDGVWASDQEVRGQVAEYDQRMRDYYERRGKPGYDWSTGAAKKFRTPLRPDLPAYLEAKGARLGPSRPTFGPADSL